MFNQIQHRPDCSPVLQFQTIDGMNDVHQDSVLPVSRRKATRILVFIGSRTNMINNGYCNHVQPSLPTAETVRQTRSTIVSTPECSDLSPPPPPPLQLPPEIHLPCRDHRRDAGERLPPLSGRSWTGEKRFRHKNSDFESIIGFSSHLVRECHVFPGIPSNHVEFTHVRPDFPAEEYRVLERGNNFPVKNNLFLHLEKAIPVKKNLSLNRKTLFPFGNVFVPLRKTLSLDEKFICL